MKKAILTLKDQILHKLVLLETKEPTGVLSKYITPNQLAHMYTNMMVISDGRVILKNITDIDDYNKLSFYYESIIHDYAKKFRLSEDEFKVIILNRSSSLSELKDALSYYEFRNDYENSTHQQPKVVEYEQPELLGANMGR